MGKNHKIQRWSKIGLIAVAAIGVAVIALRRASTKMMVKSSPAAVRQSAPVVMSSLPESKQVESQMRAAGEKLRLEAQDARALASAISSALRVYTSDSPQGFIEWIGEQHLKPPPGFETPQGAQAKWDLARRGLVDAKFDLSRCQLAYRVRAGQVLFDNSLRQEGTVKLDMSRTDRGDRDVDAAAAGSDSVEILIPARLRLADGEVYDGRLGLTFNRRPADGKWIIVKTTVCDAPGGRAGVPFPPPV